MDWNTVVGVIQIVFKDYEKEVFNNQKWLTWRIIFTDITTFFFFLTFSALFSIFSPLNR